ncbi:MAG: CopG family ribbon-helix-helix protein [Candidatus Heimdallarchaeota archaeon]
MIQQDNKAKKTETISIRLDAALLNAFDQKIQDQGFKNRSKAIKDLIAGFIAEDSLEEKYSSQAMRWGVVWTAFDHHQQNVSQALIDLQHKYQTSRLENIGSLHFHVDKKHCLEVTIVKGEEGLIHSLIDKTKTLQGTKNSGGALIIPPNL